MKKSMAKKTTKAELIARLTELLESKGMSKIDNGNGAVNYNSTKASIQSAINCLTATDAEMNDYLTVFKLKYPNSYEVIIKNGNWLTHYFNRYYVYSTAKTILA